MPGTLMRIFVDRPIMTLDGKNFEPVTSLRAALFNACIAPLESDRNLSLEDKLKVHRLAQRVSQSAESSGCLELTAEEISALKQRLNGAYPHPHFIGQIVAMLEDGFMPRELMTEAEREAEYHGRYLPINPDGTIPK